MDNPSNIDIHNNVTLCSFTPKNFGLSPGAAQGEYRYKLCTCAIERTVAPTTHGRPKRENTPIRQATINKSR